MTNEEWNEFDYELRLVVAQGTMLYIAGCDFKNEPLSVAERMRNSAKIVFELIHKRLPQEPKYTNDKIPVCPSCKRKLKRDHSYSFCPKCGQYIDWGSKNENSSV